MSSGSIMNMGRVHVQLTEEQLTRIRAESLRLQRPVASLVRQAVDQWLDGEVAKREKALAAIGGFHSGLGNLAENHDMYVGADDLVSLSEVAARSGRSANTIQTWRRRYPDFPAPVAKLASGPVWDWNDVARWIRTRRRPKAELYDGADYSRLPGYELVSAGLTDLQLGKDTIEAALVASASVRLARLGLPVRPASPGADLRLYDRVVEQVGEGRAHSQYNALRRRLSSFIRAASVAHAQVVRQRSLL
jgi:hypothetical protein